MGWTDVDGWHAYHVAPNSIFLSVSEAEAPLITAYTDAHFVPNLHQWHPDHLPHLCPVMSLHNGQKTLI